MDSLVAMVYHSGKQKMENSIKKGRNGATHNGGVKQGSSVLDSWFRRFISSIGDIRSDMEKFVRRFKALRRILGFNGQASGREKSSVGSDPARTDTIKCWNIIEHFSIF
jgi:hypothetical protein